jgi:hypothetical protein
MPAVYTQADRQRSSAIPARASRRNMRWENCSMAKRKVCGKLHCGEPLHAGGLCKKHFDEGNERHRRYMDAADVLHTGSIDGEYIREGPLRDELQRARKWRRESCDAEIAGREHPVLKDETEYGKHWCIAIAREIIDAERDLRAGKPGDTEYRKYKRDETWKRFENLERGLMSNGVERPAKHP